MCGIGLDPTPARVSVLPGKRVGVAPIQGAYAPYSMRQGEFIIRPINYCTDVSEGRRPLSIPILGLFGGWIGGLHAASQNTGQIEQAAERGSSRLQAMGALKHRDIRVPRIRACTCIPCSPPRTQAVAMGNEGRRRRVAGSLVGREIARALKVIM